tara:strand:- start:298 stop:528 length:231 start_codon:yes stop_codon:yes gene_type:complete
LRASAIAAVHGKRHHAMRTGADDAHANACAADICHDRAFLSLRYLVFTPVTILPTQPSRRRRRAEGFFMLPPISKV